jgi:hypothetical protein
VLLEITFPAQLAIAATFRSRFSTQDESRQQLKAMLNQCPKDNCCYQVSMTDISVTTKHENVWRASAQWDSPLCDRARIMAMVWFVEPANQVELDAVGTAK